MKQGRFQNNDEPEEVRQEVRDRGGAIIKIKFAREISDGMLWNDSKMAEFSQLQPAFSRVCSGIL